MGFCGNCASQLPRLIIVIIVVRAAYREFWGLAAKTFPKTIMPPPPLRRTLCAQGVYCFLYNCVHDYNCEIALFSQL